MAINILSPHALERAKAALEQLEGKFDSIRILQESARRYHTEILPRYQELLDSGEDHPRVQICIYGSGGMYRYFLDQDGVLWFSSHHVTWQDEVDKAKDLGFDII